MEAVLRRTKVAILGSGATGTDLMIKVLEESSSLELVAMAGLGAASPGLVEADRLGVPTTNRGVGGLRTMPHYGEVDIVFDVTALAAARCGQADSLRSDGKRVINLSPAAGGRCVVPAVNLDRLLGEPEVNIGTRAGQTTIPIVAAITRVTEVAYAEVGAYVASKAVGPWFVPDVDEFLRRTSSGVESVGGAKIGRTIIILSPDSAPARTRDTVLALITEPDPSVHAAVRASVEAMAAEVAEYVPGYRLRHDVRIVPFAADDLLLGLIGDSAVTHQISVNVEVEAPVDSGKGPLGSLDAATSAAVRVGDRIAALRTAPVG
ncbi:acetaldehyde dehydrogenase [Nocardia sp. NPDC057663]|uniref:acetaldehyde dehydrogenase n=1 Tax=Nocardia sp. NPDC057663 TaxID=3346201 RepID=UPI00366D8664